MPGNTIRINDSDDFEWYVGDSRMDDLIKYLNENGIKSKKHKKKVATSEKLSVPLFEGGWGIIEFMMGDELKKTIKENPSIKINSEIKEKIVNGKNGDLFAITKKIEIAEIRVVDEKLIEEVFHNKKER